MMINTDMNAEITTFTFRWNELIGLMWQVYAMARIQDAISVIPGIEKEPDPMEDQSGQNKLISKWIDELQSMPIRDDGTVEFTEEPWIFIAQQTTSQAS